MPYAFVVAGYEGLDEDGSEQLKISFVTEHWMALCSKLNEDQPGLDGVADGMHKNTERRPLCADLRRRSLAVAQMLVAEQL